MAVNIARRERRKWLWESAGVGEAVEERGLELTCCFR